MPTVASVIACEKRILENFEWKIDFILPLTFVRILLAQGILFSNELKQYEEKLTTHDYRLLR